MIPRLVPEISPCDAFCDDEEEEEKQELGILGVRWLVSTWFMCEGRMMLPIMIMIKIMIMRG